MPTTLVFKPTLAYRTPMAVDDSGTGQEDQVGFLALAGLLANDLGGPARSFWGIDQAEPRLATLTALSAEGVRLSLDLASGDILYDPTAAFESVIQSLALGGEATDSHRGQRRAFPHLAARRACP